ncbi:STAS domain-containing protein [Pseudoxanthomonas koreensis]|uniref:STAS domain-containing protein n=1 Tax=Pseudoxanthomonas koreensis TaxID=266061 RepID=UPI0013917CF3|nr:STAS domain-containing protein [Pseudoxanthomonas koreensis]KAF1694162.1 anti-sigma B factor antagonist [Pseudoxanthomonas koreensis]
MAGLQLRREGEVLHLAGELDRAAATAAWPSLPPLLAGIRSIDITAVTRLDSAGLALLAEAMTCAAAQGTPPVLHGAPEGLAELRAAYRLDAALGYADAAP